MDFLDRVAILANNQLSYMLVGAIFAFAALFLFRKIMSMFLFIVIGLLIFAIIKITLIQPRATNDTSEHVIQEKINDMQESIDDSLLGVKKMKDKVKDQVQKTVDDVKHTKDDLDKKLDKLKPKEESDFDKLMKDLEKGK